MGRVRFWRKGPQMATSLTWIQFAARIRNDGSLDQRIVQLVRDTEEYEKNHPPESVEWIPDSPKERTKKRVRATKPKRRPDQPKASRPKMSRQPHPELHPVPLSIAMGAAFRDGTVCSSPIESATVNAEAELVNSVMARLASSSSSNPEELPLQGPSGVPKKLLKKAAKRKKK